MLRTRHSTARKRKALLSPRGQPTAGTSQACACAHIHLQASLSVASVRELLPASELKDLLDRATTLCKEEPTLLEVGEG